MRNADNNKRKQTPSMYESLPYSKNPSDISSKTNNDNNIIKKPTKNK